MPKQTIEAELPKCVDLNKWEVVCFGRCKDYPELFTMGICCEEVVPVRDWDDDTYRLILRRKEPVRESMWVNAYRYCLSSSYESRESVERVADPMSRQGVIRLDYEDNKLVAVTLEPLGEGGGDE